MLRIYFTFTESPVGSLLVGYCESRHGLCAVGMVVSSWMSDKTPTATIFTLVWNLPTLYHHILTVAESF